MLRTISPEQKRALRGATSISPASRSRHCFGQCDRDRDDVVAVAHGGDRANLSA